ncbi:MAG: quinone oxidoreductase family protein [Planctomycetota bacterium]
MKAAVYYETGSPDVFRYEEVPDPICEPGGVVIDVEAVSIEGGDTLNRLGGMMAARPHIVGYQCAGVIAEVGAGVEDRSVGQRVVCTGMHGSHAEKRALPAAATWVVPDGLASQVAACVPIPVGTADDCLFEFGRLQAGEAVLVQAGASALGMAAIQLAKRAGATVLATASSAAKLERLAEFGLDHGIDYLATDFVAAARELTGGRGPDLVVDCVGGRTLQGSMECAAYRGRIISVGGAGRESFSPDLTVLRPANKTLTGVFLGAELVFHRDRVHPMIQGHLQAVADGDLRIEIDRTYPLAQAAEAHAYIESRAAFGRVLLIP